MESKNTRITFNDGKWNEKLVLSTTDLLPPRVGFDPTLSIPCYFHLNTQGLEEQVQNPR